MSNLRMFKRFILIAVVLVALAAVATVGIAAHAATGPTGSITGWQINKTVSSSTLNLLKGDSATVTYTITLTPPSTPVTIAPALTSNNLPPYFLVVDSNGKTFSFPADFTKALDSKLWSVSYTTTYACDTDSGSHSNTATLQGSDGSIVSLDAVVKVTCFDLTVTKTALTSLTRTYAWNISKTVDQSNLTLPLSKSTLVNYKVAVSATPVDSKQVVSGTITVSSPADAPYPANILSVTDLMSGLGAISLTCDANIPGKLAPGSSLHCTYSANLPDDMARTNTGTATLQNYNFAGGKVTQTGTTDFSGTAAVDFSNATLTEVNKTVNVSDTFAGLLGQVNATDTLPAVFTYSRLIGPYTAAGSHDVSNTATFVATDDAKVTGSASVTVHVIVVAEPKLPKTGSNPFI